MISIDERGIVHIKGNTHDIAVEAIMIASSVHHFLKEHDIVMLAAFKHELMEVVAGKLEELGEFKERNAENTAESLMNSIMKDSEKGLE